MRRAPQHPAGACQRQEGLFVAYSINTALGQTLGELYIICVMTIRAYLGGAFSSRDVFRICLRNRLCLFSGTANRDLLSPCTILQIPQASVIEASAQRSQYPFELLRLLLLRRQWDEQRGRDVWLQGHTQKSSSLCLYFPGVKNTG